MSAVITVARSRNTRQAPTAAGRVDAQVGQGRRPVPGTSHPAAATRDGRDGSLQVGSESQATDQQDDEGHRPQRHRARSKQIVNGRREKENPGRRQAPRPRGPPQGRASRRSRRAARPATAHDQPGRAQEDRSGQGAGASPPPWRRGARRRSKSALTRIVRAAGSGRVYPAVPALALLEIRDGLEQVPAAEVRPEDVGHPDLGVGDLPEQEVARPASRRWCG